jgi:PAS domain S-box-containing protein
MSVEPSRGAADNPRMPPSAAAVPEPTTGRPHPMPRDDEAPFRLEELFFSTTDRRGVIAYGNETFVRISGYDSAEMIGSAHSIVRHPDMPRTVFRLLWDGIQAGRTIVAYVKNLAADGRYYWVCAMVTPIDGGYLSLRLKPSTARFEQVQALYRDIRRVELEIEGAGGSRPDAIEAGARRLDEALAALGTDGYEPFMERVLLDEVGARRRALQGRGAARRGRLASAADLAGAAVHCGRIEREVRGLFARLDAFAELERGLDGKISFVRLLAEDLRRMAVNAEVRTARLGHGGRTLQVVAGQMAASARSVSATTRRMCERMREVADALRSAGYRIATSDLSVEMMGRFIGELGATDGGPADGAGKRIAQLAEVAAGNIEATCDIAERTGEQLRHFEQELSGFLREIRTLEILHLTGKVESVSCTEAEGVASLFQDVHARTVEARQELAQLAELAAAARIPLPDRGALGVALAALRRAG